MCKKPRSLSSQGLDYLKLLKRPEGVATVMDSFPHHPQIIQLQNKINYRFHDYGYLFQALCHRSFIHEQKQGLGSNERFEFLGDSLLGILVTKELFHRYPDLTEGDLSKIRGALVNKDRLSEVSQFIGLPDMIFLGKGELAHKKEVDSSLWADAFESFIAAIYLDSSLLNCLECLKKVLLDFDRDFFSDKHLLTFDSKTKLQELSLKYYKVLPTYRSQELKKDGKSYFTVEVLIKDQFLDRLHGHSKKKIQKELAEKVIKEQSLQLFVEEKSNAV